MRRLALLMLLGDAVGTVIYALLADYSGATYPTREARIDFAAGIDLYANYAADDPAARADAAADGAPRPRRPRWRWTAR